MMYKTMVLELLEQRRETYDQLRKQRKLLPTLELYAKQLKASHEGWQDRLMQAKPASDASQIASEALEIAVKELEDRLRSDSPPDENDPLSLEGAMTYLRRHTPPA